MFGLFEEKPDHPLFDLEETRRLISELPQDDHRQALEDITFWLDSIKTAKGFQPGARAPIILLLDETALPLQAELLRQYLGVPHLLDFKGMLQWQCLHAYARALTEACAASIEEYRTAEKKPFDLKQQLPLFCVRWMRAVAEQMKLELMRYLDVEPAVWRHLGACQRFAEAEQIAESMVLPYAGNVIHVSPQRELLRALLLYVAAPEALAPDQIEVAFRIAGRLCGFFDLKAEAHDDCPHRFDLSAGEPPHRAEREAAPAARHFGGVRALPALQRILQQNEDDPVWQERRFGSEFTPGGKLTVLKHLLAWWAPQPPVRHSDHRGIDTTVEVIHGFRLIGQLVTRIELAETADAHGIGLARDGEIDYTAEVWKVTDIGVDEIGIKLDRSAGAWVKVGDLCGTKAQHAPVWWLGAIRRVHTDADNHVHVVIGILTRKPLSIWLRALGKGAEKASNWETSSGSFQYSYVPAILLPDANNSFLKSTMLMESRAFVPGNYYQALMGEKSHDLKLTALLSEGEDFEHVAFEWLAQP